MTSQALRRAFAPLLLLVVAALLRGEACTPKVKGAFTSGPTQTIRTSKLKTKAGNDGSKSLSKKLGLSKGSDAMDRVDLDKAHKARMKQVNTDIRLAKAVKKAEIKGKPLKGWAKKAQEDANAKKAAERMAAVRDLKKADGPAQSAESLVEKMNKLKAESVARRSAKTSAGTSGSTVAQISPPPKPPKPPKPSVGVPAGSTGNQAGSSKMSPVKLDSLPDYPLGKRPIKVVP